MKKTYLKPNTDVIAVKTQQMIAASLPTNETPGDNGVVLSREADDFGFTFEDEDDSFDY